MGIQKQILKDELNQQCQTLLAYASRLKGTILDCGYGDLLNEIESIETILDTIEHCKYKIENCQEVFRLFVSFAYYDDEAEEPEYKAEVTEIEMLYDSDLEEYLEEPLRNFDKKERFNFVSVSYDFESEDFYDFNCLTDAVINFIEKEINGMVIPWSVVILSYEVVEKE